MGKPIILIGFKASGKSTIGAALAKRLNINFIDTDTMLEELYMEITEVSHNSRQIHKEHGRDYFLDLEAIAIKKTLGLEDVVVSFGGGAVENARTRDMDLDGPVYVFLNVTPGTLYQRIMEDGMPAFFDSEDPRGSFDKLYIKRIVDFGKLATISVDNENRTVDDVLEELMQKLGAFANS